MKLLFILLIVLDLIAVYKLLNTVESKPTTTKVVNIYSTPRRVRTFIDIPTEEEEDLEELKERLKQEFKLKVVERRKAWERENIWNVESNLEKFRIKNGIISQETANNKIDGGLFSLSTV